MKKRILLALCAILCACFAIAGDHPYDGTTFTISSNVKLPVYVRFGGKQITISSYQYTTYTRISDATITDANGNRCMYRHSTDNHSGTGGNYVHHYYNITGIYSSSNSSSNNSYGGSSYNSDSRASQLGAQLGSAAMQMQAMERVYNNYHAGGFSLAATMSAAWGENLDLRFRYGSSSLGGDITVMLGHDWLKKIDGILWNVGIGMYFGGRPSDIYLWDIDLGVKLGHCNNPNKKSFTAMIDLSTTHLIGPQHIIGLTAGAGIGLDGEKKADFVWDVRGGIVIYFLQWNWF